MDFHFVKITDMDGEGTIEMSVMDGDVRFWYYPDWIDFAFVPILAPPDTDHVGCRAPRLRFMRASSGRPYFEWTAYTDEETLQYEVQYAQLGSNEWRTTYPTSSPFRIIDNFDATKYYTARIRMQHRHGCPIHDTVYWSPWSDTVLFYTGSTAPDTTTSITPVEGCSDGLFTLSPNPATGTVTVSCSTGSILAPAHSSPKLGEVPFRAEECVKALTITLTDAAGREVLRKEFSIVNCQFSIPLDLSGLPAGTYFVTLTTPTATGTQRLVVR
ncbi:MAG: T9SS type A sorting domain-containing protein [Bacteroidales bacterium]|nr:T9SS type A sorting domain-containing protein [Bacteroidales bacterium]